MALGSIARGLGINVNSIVGGIAQKMFPGAGGKLIGGLAGGIASFMTGDPMGAIQGGLRAFSGLMGGLSNLGGAGGMNPGMGSFPQMPGMGGGFGLPGMPSPGGSSGGLNNTFGLNPNSGPLQQLGQLQNLMSNPNAVKSLAQDPSKMFALQQKMQQLQQTFQLMTQMSKKMHDISMAVIRNI